MRAIKTKASAESGFTLLELTLVLMLVGLFAALTVPYFASVLDRVGQDSEVRKIASSLRQARNEAVAHKRMVTFNGDLSENRYWITERGTEAPITTNRKLSASLHLTEFSNHNESLNEGTFAIRFFPMGNASGGSIRLEPEPSGKDSLFYAIHIDPITGTPRIEKAVP